MKAFKIKIISANYVGYELTGIALTHDHVTETQLEDAFGDGGTANVDAYDLLDGFEIEEQCEEDGDEFDGFDVTAHEVDYTADLQDLLPADALPTDPNEQVFYMSELGQNTFTVVNREA